jgi:uncharacterized damage-inducible protein DinB
MTTEYFRKMFDYDLWANQRALESIVSSPGQEEALRFMAHIVGAHQIWLSRLGALAVTPASPWPNLSLEDCGPQLVQIHSAWKALISGMKEEQLAGEISYRNSKGVEFRNLAASVLQHVVMHSAYHRGQVAAAVRRAGGAPASTDYIVYERGLSKSA